MKRLTILIALLTLVLGLWAGSDMSGFPDGREPEFSVYDPPMTPVLLYPDQNGTGEEGDIAAAIISGNTSPLFGEEPEITMHVRNVYPGGVTEVVATLNDDETAVELTWTESDKGQPNFSGYLVYRLKAGQEENEHNWTALTPEATIAYNYTDTGWDNLPLGYYRWVVRAVYNGDILSYPCFSNVLTKGPMLGTLVGTVSSSKDGSPISGATVSVGTHTATTNAIGFYFLELIEGNHDVTAAKRGFYSQTIEDVAVYYNQFFTLNFSLDINTPIDDPQIPVVATSLSGNYPNPFNPETTISYSVKEPGRVRLEIYNIRGQLIRTLVDSDHATGHYKQVFNSKDNRGNPISSGVYLIRMSAPEYRKTSKMILMQ
ncbi:MAG: carboxypeptidase regulatory-like domain-containing protein [Candidatus Cloacimonadaceae bacterium]|jgi:hypothetical protein